MVNLSYSSSKNACSHNEWQQTSDEISLRFVFVMPWHLGQLKSSNLSLCVWVVFCQTAVHSSSLRSPLVQNSDLVQIFNYSNTCLFSIDETCGLCKILAVSVCELSLGFIGWVAIEERWVGEFWETADKTDEGLLSGVFDFVSGSDVLEAVWEKSSTEKEPLGIGSVLILLDQQRNNALKSISTINNIGHKTLIPVDGSATNFNCT